MNNDCRNDSRILTLWYVMRGMNERMDRWIDGQPDG